MERRLTEVHGVVLTGGSAYGLASADGVMKWLAEQGIGYETQFGIVPIVPAAVVFDLGSGDPTARPGQEEGRAACEAAREEFETGRVGAGTGVTVGKWTGPPGMPGGLGAARVSEGPHVVHALAVVNSVGDVLDERGEVLAGTTEAHPTFRRMPLPPEEPPANTVLVAVTVRARLQKRDVHWLSARASDGVTATVRPAHTRYDGDVSFAIAIADDIAGEDDLDVLGWLTTRAVAAAVRDAVS